MFDDFNMQQCILHIKTYYKLCSYNNINHVRSHINTILSHKPIIHYNIKEYSFITEVNRQNTWIYRIIFLINTLGLLTDSILPCTLSCKGPRTQLWTVLHTSMYTVAESSFFSKTSSLFFLLTHYIHLHHQSLFLRISKTHLLIHSQKSDSA